MDRSLPSLNSIVQKRALEHLKKIHKHNLKNAKPMVDNGPPESSLIP